MKVMMSVDMVERQACRSVGRELRLDLGGHLRARAWTQKNFEPGPREVVAQPPVAVDEIRNALRRQHRHAVDEHEMEPDAKRRQAACSRHRVFGRRSCHHEACRSQDAVGVRQLHTGVHFRRQAEIVGRDDETLQWAPSCRSRRK